jgi:hypothetical protein
MLASFAGKKQDVMRREEQKNYLNKLLAILMGRVTWTELIRNLQSALRYAAVVNLTRFLTSVHSNCESVLERMKTGTRTLQHFYFN